MITLLGKIGILMKHINFHIFSVCLCVFANFITTEMIPQEREMDMRKQALEEERRRREDLEKRLQEETSRRQKLIDREVKMREKQRAQVGKLSHFLLTIRELYCSVIELDFTFYRE